MSEPRVPNGQRGGREDRNPPSPGWLLLLLRLAIPPSYPHREELIGDLLEEFSQIAQQRGLKAAKWWFLRQVVGCLRLSHVALPPGWLKDSLRRKLATQVYHFALFLYLLPAVVLVLMLHGVYLIIRPLLDRIRRVGGPAPPEHILLLVLYLLTPRSRRDDLFGDLYEEYRLTEREASRTKARRWLRQQIYRSIFWCLRWRLERLGGILWSEGFFVLLVHIALCLYLLPAVVLLVGMHLIGILIGFLVDSAGRFPPFRRLMHWICNLLRDLMEDLRRFLGRFLSDVPAVTAAMPAVPPAHLKPVGTLTDREAD